ncbi:MAG: uncharacterized protein JWN98_2007, partial [Abditibacteriota bacterium]|nr:uncharacterized protein [Abditibacteriota bacterium]
TGYGNTNVDATTAYTYRVRAYNAGGQSAYSNTARAIRLTVPVAPSTLKVVSVSRNQIDLSWRDNARNEVGYKIERSINGTAFTHIATVRADVSSYPSGGLSPERRYFYRVRAYNSVGNSAYSNTVSAHTTR